MSGSPNASAPPSRACINADPTPSPWTSLRTRPDPRRLQQAPPTCAVPHGDGPSLARAQSFRTALAAMLTRADHRGRDTAVPDDPAVDDRDQSELGIRRIGPQSRDQADLVRFRAVVSGERTAMDGGDRVSVACLLPSDQHAPQCDRLHGMPTLTRTELARMIDHTLLNRRQRRRTSSPLSLKPSSWACTPCASRRRCFRSMRRGSSSRPSPGFPSGKHHSSVKAAEARLARVSARRRSTW